jgi:hypothetical protein
MHACLSVRSSRAQDDDRPCPDLVPCNRHGVHRSSRDAGDAALDADGLLDRALEQLRALPQPLRLSRMAQQREQRTFGLMTPEEIAAATDAIVGLLDYVDDLASRRRRDAAAEPVT